MNFFNKNQESLKVKYEYLEVNLKNIEDEIDIKIESLTSLIVEADCRLKERLKEIKKGALEYNLKL